MRFPIHILITLSILMLVSCTQKRTSDPYEVAGEEIPEDAEILPYASDPDMAHVNIYGAPGQIVESGELYKGKKSGIWMRNHLSTGTAYIVNSYVNGVRNGHYMVFEENGGQKIKAFYANGELEGDYIIFKNKKVVEERFYRAGKLQGMLRKYYTNGNIKEESPYKDGVINGTARWYDQGGNVTIEYTYEDGKLINQGNE